VWLYLLRHKSEVFQVFNDFQHMVERQHNCKILAVQTDWGGEYQSLNSFFQRIGITHRVSCPYAHQQNGSAKRKHRHIVEVGLTLLSQASMPLKFGGEHSFMPCISLTDFLLGLYVIKLPFFRLFGKDPEYTDLRVFGSACWPNLRPFNTRKLEFRSKPCVFLGFSNLHKGYKCLDPKDGRVYISRDVIFDEHIFPFASLHPNVGTRLRAEILLLPNHLYPVDANDCGHSMSPTEPTDPSTSCVGDSAAMAKNLVKTGVDFRA
jgi:histone deacetylase 1/2